MINYEDLAAGLGDSLVALRQRLDGAVLTLPAPDQLAFIPRTLCRLDFDNKRLYSRVAGVYLQWQLRPQPDQPIGPTNRQTATGHVVFYKDNKACLR